jgi:hypothetical protein
MSALATYGSISGIERYFEELAAAATKELRAECAARGHDTLWKTEPSDRQAYCFDCRTMVDCPITVQKSHSHVLPKSD